MRLAILILVAWTVSCGCRTGERPAPTAATGERSAHPLESTSVRLEPAPTPGEAFERAMRAMAEGDEAAWRRIVVYRPPCMLVEAQARSSFAGARLHRAVQEHSVTGRRVRDAGFDRNERLVVNPPPSPKQVEQSLEMCRQVEWKLDGDLATPATTRPIFSPDKRMTVERTGGGWVLVISNPDGIPDSEPQLRQSARSSIINAKIFDAATAKVNAGKLRTIREVNDFIDKQREASAEQALAELKARPPAGPTLVVTDDDTGEPVAGVRVWSEFATLPSSESLYVVTDEHGRARFPAEPEKWIHSITVSADGYARHPSNVSVHREAGRPDEICVAIGKPAVVEVMLVLPDERRAALSVYEGDDYDPSPPGLARTIEPRRIKVSVQWEDEPPKLPQHHPLLRLQFTSSPHEGKKGVVHRVTHAQTAAGRDLPVFRDAPPSDPHTFGLYDIGRNGLRDTVFVIGALSDARATEAVAFKLQWMRNDKVLGPATQSDAR